MSSSSSATPSAVLPFASAWSWPKEEFRNASRVFSSTSSRATSSLGTRARTLSSRAVKGLENVGVGEKGLDLGVARGTFCSSSYFLLSSPYLSSGIRPNSYFFSLILFSSFYASLRLLSTSSTTVLTCIESDMPLMITEPAYCPGVLMIKSL